MSKYKKTCQKTSFYAVIAYMRDFTLQKYRLLCESIIRSKYKPITVEKYFSNKSSPDKFIILRHDVDRKPERAEIMAAIESEMDIQSTYYFRKNNQVFKPDIIKRVSNMGHEIGYHYEVMDRSQGNISKAYTIFKDELAQFRDIVETKTVAMHGNPLTKWINSDLLKYYKISEFSLTGEASLINDENIFYYTDTGRGWDSSKYNIKDFISNNCQDDKAQTTNDIINIIAKQNSKYKLYLSAHPNRWNDDAVKWSMQFAEDCVANLIKLCITRRFKTK